MRKEKALINLLRRAVDLLAEEAERNPALASKLAELHSPVTERTTSHRKAAARQEPVDLPDIYKEFEARGHVEFRLWLRDQPIVVMRGLIRQHDFDAAKRTGKWTADKLSAFITDQLQGRLARGSSFLRGEPRFPLPDTGQKIDSKEDFSEAVFQREQISKKASVLRLAQLRTEGVAIRNKAVEGKVSDDNLVLWLSEVNDWMNRSVEAILQINEADAELFKTLDTVPAARVSAPTFFKNVDSIQDFVKAYNEHDKRLVRIEELAKKYTTAY